MNCLNLIGKSNDKAVLYDPCCGGGYLLTILGFLCGSHIDSLYGSDISSAAIKLAKENLNLLTIQGLIQRKEQLIKMYHAFNKESHADAIKSIKRLSQIITNQKTALNFTVFENDILDKKALLQNRFKADIVFTDVPYDHLVTWSKENSPTIDELLNTLIPILNDHSIVAICSNKSQKIANHRFRRVKKYLIGKRKIELLKKVCDNHER
jgi:16S rRNA G966 N2-methylase RsmD